MLLLQNIAVPNVTTQMYELSHCFIFALRVLTIICHQPCGVRLLGALMLSDSRLLVSTTAPAKSKRVTFPAYSSWKVRVPYTEE